MKQTMKAAFLTTFGGPDVVSIGETALRDMQPDEATVRIEAAGVNPLDLKIVAGDMQQVFSAALPYIPGNDFSAVVEVAAHRSRICNRAFSSRVVRTTARHSHSPNSAILSRARGH